MNFFGHKMNENVEKCHKNFVIAKKAKVLQYVIGIFICC
jgi:hypothetical protein